MPRFCESYTTLDRLTTALMVSAILVTLDFLGEQSSVLVTYNSIKCYIFALNPTKSLIGGLLLNLTIFAIVY